MLDIALDVLGVGLLCALAWFVWEPLPLGVAGAALLVVSWRRSR